MAWLPSSVPGNACRLLFLKRCWSFSVRSMNSRPTPSLNFECDGEQQTPRKKSAAAFVKTMKYKSQAMPPKLIQAVGQILAEFSVTNLQRDAKELNHFLAARHPPTEDAVMQTTAKSLEEQYIAEHKNISEQKLKNFVIKKLKSSIYHWKPFEVDSEYDAAVYLVARLASEYAGVLYCLHQIAEGDATFRPHAVLNYGSGLGAGLWAARQLWGGAVREFVGIESRRRLLELSELLTQGGVADGPLDPNVFFRPLLPVSSRLQYPLVVSSHALAELPSQQARLECVATLWERTAAGGRLTVLETGNNAGYGLTLEARDLLLRLGRHKGGAAHVEAPCPHDAACPRFSRSLTPCHFSVPHPGLQLVAGAIAPPAFAKLSYVTVRKAARPASDRQWPRVVQPVLVRPRHVICRLCTSRGQLEEVVVTKRRHGSELYQCAKAARWGGTLPVLLQDAAQPAEGDR